MTLLENEDKYKSFFVETTNIVEPKLFMNGHCLVGWSLTQLGYSCSISNMTVKAEHGFNIGPYRKMNKKLCLMNYKHVLTQIIHERYLDGLLQSCIFKWIRKSRWPSPLNKSNIGSYGENIEGKLFLSKTTKSSDNRLCWNVHWVVLY